MLTYLAAFIFYTLAMVGILIGGFIVYKKTFAPIKNENKGMIKVIDSYSIAPKKNLMVIQVRNENFLIALDSERTTFLTKLDDRKAASKVLEERLANSDYEIDEDISQEIQDVLQEKTSRYDDMRKTRNDEIQKQFMQLYKKDEPVAHNIQQIDELSKRKQMIRRLISELNSNKKAGSKY